MARRFGPAPVFARMVPTKPAPYGNSADIRSRTINFNRAGDFQYAPDVEELDRISAATRDVVPLADVYDFLDANNRPPQLVQTFFLAVIPSVGIVGAQMLMGGDPRRQSLTVALPGLTASGNTGVVVSYEKPLALGGNLISGLPLDPRNILTETNGSVTVNEIWVGSVDPAATYPITVVGYAGKLSIAGNVK